jgi:outer membrane protein TolC
MVLFCFVVLSAIFAYAYDNDQYSFSYADAANLAVASSIELRQAHITQSFRRGEWIWGIRAYFPRLNFSVSENDYLQISGADTFYKSFGIGADQLLFDGGKIALARKIERKELDFALSTLDKMASDIADNAISAYRNILFSREILEIRKAALLVLEEQRRILKEETSLGLALKIDLANADINLTDAKLGIHSLQLDLYEMEGQLAELLGLDNLPVLTEKIDVNRAASLPAPDDAGVLAKERNPDILNMRYSILKKNDEIKYLSKSWIPSLRLTGNLEINGQRYPLNHFKWSLGINIDFSNILFQNRFGAQAGGEYPDSKAAIVQNAFTLAPDPSVMYQKKHAKLALVMEQDRYRVILERAGRIAANAVEKCVLAERKRVLALDAASIAAERSRIEEIRLSLGFITRLQLMEALIEQTQREVAVVEAAAALLEAERELERFLDLQPGGLASFGDSLKEFQFNKRNNL